MGRGNFFINDGAVVYVDQDQMDGEFGFENLVEDLSFIVNNKNKVFFENQHWERDVQFRFDSEFLKVGFADNETSTAVVFKPRERLDGEMDQRAFPMIRRIVKELLKIYDLHGRSGPWTSFKVETAAQII